MGHFPLYDSSEDESAYDLPSFERNRRRLHPSPRVRLAKAQPEAINVLRASRKIGRHDAIRLKPLVAGVLNQLDFADLSKLKQIPELGVSLTTAHDARYIFRKHHLNEQDGLSAARFNRLLRQNIANSKNKNPLLFAQLGEIGIFGAGSDEAGARFIGPEIVKVYPPGALKQERQSMLNAVTPSLATVDMLNEDYTDHLSLVRTDSEATAQRVMNVMQVAGMEGIWVTLLPPSTDQSTVGY